MTKNIFQSEEFKFYAKIHEATGQQINNVNKLIKNNELLIIGSALESVLKVRNDLYHELKELIKEVHDLEYKIEELDSAVITLESLKEQIDGTIEILEDKKN